MFIHNTWYVAAFSDDIKLGERLGRRLLDEPVVLFRTEHGEIAALEDRCSHRAMPLSAGDVDGDIIRCCYHGLEFDTHGACTRIPTQTRIPSVANVRSYPVAEKDHLIWIWMGDPDRADPATIVDCPELSNPDWDWRSYTFPVEANWQLIIDNVLDLTHVPYIHARTIGGNPEQHYKAEVHTDFDGDKLVMTSDMRNSIPPRSYVDAAGFEGRVDRRRVARFEPTRGMTVHIRGGGCTAGTGDYDNERGEGFALVNNHFPTPETETTSHYMWTICTPKVSRSGKNIMDELSRQFFDTISEDETTLQQQQQRINDDPDRAFVGIASDGAVNQARRILRTMAAAENT